MAFEIRRGTRSVEALWEGKLLSSAYGPEREAQAWADRLELAPGSLVFVAGDPWGLAAEALGRRGHRAIALVPGAAARAFLPASVEAWAPEDGPLEDFLGTVFETTGPDGVVWQVWPAFERLAPGVVIEWSRRFRDLFRTVQGSWLTHRRFGPRFWRNAVRNLVDWERPSQLVPGDRPVVIAASGPSLDDGLEVLARNRNQFDLWALPSSFETLVRRGLVPDAGVATDGGFYAREHLHRLSGTGVPLLAALGSAADPVLATLPCLFFSQGLPVERALLGALGPRYTEVPSQGTVAVTALRMALEATTGPVLVAGLDLSFRDLRGHTSPHTVDRRLGSWQGRLAPEEGLWAERFFDQATVVHEGARTSPALVTYALWFASRARFSRTVYRISPSALRWSTMEEVSWTGAQQFWSTGGRRAIGWAPPSTWPGRQARRALVREVLNSLASRAARCAPTDPWLTEVARTAVPGALADDFRARRLGDGPSQVPEALADFWADLGRFVP